jgi:hypothetical protein
MGFEIAGHWSYTGNPDSSTRDKVRFLVGDIDSSDKLTSNEEIDSALAERGSTYGAASMVCRAIAARFARLVTKSVNEGGSTRTNNLSDLYKHYLELTAEFARSAASQAGTGVYAGGISISDKQSAEDDTDRVVPAFHAEMLDSPGNTPTNWPTTGGTA